ncbi:MAG: ribbon-helix-helix protein, CopG family [Actinomycetota bacterium]
MARRTQITLEEPQYKLLQAMSIKTGLSMSELIRRAIDRTYVSGALAALEASFGAWKDRDFDGAEYVERLRRGLGVKLEEIDDRAG